MWMCIKAADSETRCPHAIEKCKQEPLLEEISDGRQVACFVKIN